MVDVYVACSQPASLLSNKCSIKLL